MRFVSEIFAIQHFQSLVSKQTLLEGRACADPFIVAKANFISGCVLQKIQYNRMLQKYLTFVSISESTSRIFKDSWKEKTGVSNPCLKALGN